jgi:hypothetical protein
VGGHFILETTNLTNLTNLSWVATSIFDREIDEMREVDMAWVDTSVFNHGSHGKDGSLLGLMPAALDRI